MMSEILQHFQQNMSEWLKTTTIKVEEILSHLNACDDWISLQKKDVNFSGTPDYFYNQFQDYTSKDK